MERINSEGDLCPVKITLQVIIWELSSLQYFANQGVDLQRWVSLYICFPHVIVLILKLDAEMENVILPLYKSIVSPRYECCIQFWSPPVKKYEVQ